MKLTLLTLHPNSKILAASTQHVEVPHQLPNWLCHGRDALVGALTPTSTALWRYAKIVANLFGVCCQGSTASVSKTSLNPFATSFWMTKPYKSFWAKDARPEFRHPRTASCTIQQAANMRWFYCCRASFPGVESSEMACMQAMLPLHNLQVESGRCCACHIISRSSR